MSAIPEEFARKTARLSDQVTEPFPASRKIYVQGSRPDIRVPMREVRLTPEEQSVCYAMDCHDTAGRVCVNIPTTRGLVGKLNYVKNLPMYDLFFNFMGRRVARRLVPQNPAKRAGNGTYSALAVQAQQGHKIMHIFENDPAVKEHNKRQRKFDGVNKIVDGVFDQ